jgi:hypothetical protein
MSNQPEPQNQEPIQTESPLTKESNEFKYGVHWDMVRTYIKSLTVDVIALKLLSYDKKEQLKYEHELKMLAYKLLNIIEIGRQGAVYEGSKEEFWDTVVMSKIEDLIYDEIADINPSTHSARSIYEDVLSKIKNQAIKMICSNTPFDETGLKCIDFCGIKDIIPVVSCKGKKHYLLGFVFKIENQYAIIPSLTVMNYVDVIFDHLYKTSPYLHSELEKHVDNPRYEIVSDTKRMDLPLMGDNKIGDKIHEMFIQMMFNNSVESMLDNEELDDLSNQNNKRRIASKIPFEMSIQDITNGTSKYFFSNLSGVFNHNNIEKDIFHYKANIDNGDYHKYGDIVMFVSQEDASMALYYINNTVISKERISKTTGFLNDILNF